MHREAKTNTRSLTQEQCFREVRLQTVGLANMITKETQDSCPLHHFIKETYSIGTIRSMRSVCTEEYTQYYTTGGLKIHMGKCHKRENLRSDSSGVSPPEKYSFKGDSKGGEV